MNELPIGTILTVPKDTYLVGWEDVTELNSTIAPVRAGSIKLSFGMDESEVWKDWDKVNLFCEPELNCAVQHFIECLPCNDSRTVWGQYIATGKLPPIRGLFPKFGNYVGEFSVGSNSHPMIMPFIEHTENMFRPIGHSTDEPPKKVYSPYMGGKTQFDNTAPTFPSPFVLLAQRASVHNLEDTPVYTSTEDGVGVSIPPNLEFKLLVCTQTYYPNVPLTHKLIIKVE